MSKLLIVDDSADTRDALCRFFEHYTEHRVESVPNGKAALTAVIDRTPDLVILDLCMPEMDGVNFLEVLRSYLRLQHVPVVVLTGVPDSPMVARARRLGVNTILVKGKVSLEELAEVVRQELRRAGVAGITTAGGDSPSACSR
jgi:CheY-like chemotaxis protein